MAIKILKKIFSVFKFLITAVILLIVAIILVQRISNNTKTILGYRIFTVVTESMVPKYNVGDVLLVKEKDKNLIQIGEDVAYQGEKGDFANKIVTHQVINIESSENGELVYHTKGIANEQEDPTITANQIYGIVLQKLQLMSWINGIINNMYGMYFLIVIPLAVIFFTEMRGIKKDFDSKKNGEEDDDEEDEDEDIDEDKQKDKNIESKNKELDKKIDKKAQKRKEKRAKRRQKYE